MWFFGLIVVLLIGAVAVVASGRWGAMAPAYDDRPDLTVPARQALTADDLETARFGVGLRGYRMDEVDTLLERVAREVAERDRRIADLERAVSPIIHGPEGAGFTARADYQPADFDDTGYNKPILVGGDFPTSEQDEKIVEAPPAPEAAAKPEAQVAPQPPTEPQPEQPAQPPADPPPAATEPPAAAEVIPEAAARLAVQAPAAAEAAAALEEMKRRQASPEQASPPEAAAEAEAEPAAGGWFDEVEPHSVLDEEPKAPVPLPPLLQELVHTHDEGEPEGGTWFEAKEPPPEYSDDESAEQTDVPADEDGQSRGRHSAAPDVSAVQRPN